MIATCRFQDKGLERAKELWEFNQGTDREDIFLFEMASFYLAKSNGKPGPDQDSVIGLYKTLVDRFPKSDLSLWADVWLKTVPSQSLGKWISQNEELSTITKPSDFSFSKNYPNPFNPETAISYASPKESHVLIEVYNGLGQKIATLVNEHFPTGYHTTRWDGRDAADKKAPAGIYLCRM